MRGTTSGRVGSSDSPEYYTIGDWQASLRMFHKFPGDPALWFMHKHIIDGIVDYGVAVYEPYCDYDPDKIVCRTCGGKLNSDFISILKISGDLNVLEEGRANRPV